MQSFGTSSFSCHATLDVAKNSKVLKMHTLCNGLFEMLTSKLQFMQIEYDRLFE
ncbi:hypothetical protein Csa_017809, partial [Cucumis sativus]